MIKLNKKADLSIQMIVVIVLALVIMLIVLGITTGKLKIFGTAAASCTSRGGTCQGIYDKNQPFKCPNDGSVYIPGTECEDNTKGCCQEIFAEKPAEKK